MSENIRHTGGNMRIEALRKLADREEVDYQFLVSVLKDYSRPRDKITAWLKSKDLIRIKKGLYVFGKNVSLTPYSLEILANLIYGPSAISLGYALSFYGLIPERVSVVTSITNKRHKEFSTPAGDFTYYFLHPKKYYVGIVLKAISSNRQFFIATQEKALCDQIQIIDKNVKFNDLRDVESYLLHDLRIDKAALKNLSVTTLYEIAMVYQNKNLKLLTQFLKKWKK